MTLRIGPSDPAAVAGDTYVDAAGATLKWVSTTLAGDPVWEKLVDAAESPWLPAVGATLVADGDKHIIMNGAALTVPAIPVAGDSISMSWGPDGEWESANYTVTTAGADTFPNVEVFGNALVTVIGLPGETEWRVLEGAEGSLSSTIVVQTRADLPAASSVFAGRVAAILDENGQISTALGTAGQPAVGWSI